MSLNAFAPQDTRLRPLKALRAASALMAHPDDTRQVFEVIAALRGRSGQRGFARFAASAVGQAVLADHPALAALPEGSLGRDYLAFMQAENLSAAGLMEASLTEDVQRLGPDARHFRDRM